MVLLILTRLRISLIPSGLPAFHASDELQYDFKWSYIMQNIHTISSKNYSLNPEQYYD
jgi:hypothetical protein